MVIGEIRRRQIIGLDILTAYLAANHRRIHKDLAAGNDGVLIFI